MRNLTLGGELQDLVVFLGASAQPDVVLVVDEYPVLRGEPFIAGARRAPRLQEPAIGVELQDGGRRNAAFRLWRVERRASFAFRDGGRAVEDPEVVMRIDRQAADLAGGPLVGQRLRPERIRLEERHLLPGRLSAHRHDTDLRRSRPARLRCPSSSLSCATSGMTHIVAAPARNTRRVGPPEAGQNSCLRGEAAPASRSRRSGAEPRWS